MLRTCVRRTNYSLRTCLFRGAPSSSSVCTAHRYSHHDSGESDHGGVYWSIAGTLAIGAAGLLTYKALLDDEVRPHFPLAKCGTVDHWSYNKVAAKVNGNATKPNSADQEPTVAEEQNETPAPPVPQFPTQVPYLIIGSGTAAMAAYRAIRTSDINAKVLLVGEEPYKPYMRPPLSKEMWFTEDRALVNQLKFAMWGGKEKSMFFEHDSYYCTPEELTSSAKGGVAVATGIKVTKLNTQERIATLEDGRQISYEKCLIATGGRPRNLPTLERPGLREKTTLFRGIDDFKKLDAVTDTSKSVLIIGGGFLGSELACALGKKALGNGMKVTQVFPEEGNMGRVLPKYLSSWTTKKVRSENVEVIPNVSVDNARLSENGQQVELLLNSGEVLAVDHVVVAVGLEPNTGLAESAGLELDSKYGGFLVNSELEAASNVWVAGDAACFYDVQLGRRRVEHHDHAVVSGRLAGENMTGAAKRFTHQSMFWSDLGPSIGYEAIGLVDSELPTVAVFAKASKQDTPQAVAIASGESLRSEVDQEQAPSLNPEVPEGEDFGKGVIFYLKGKKVVGVVCWNVFNKIGVARKVINDGAEHEDLTEVAKLFELHPSAQENSAGA